MFCLWIDYNTPDRIVNSFLEKFLDGVHQNGLWRMIFNNEVLISVLNFLIVHHQKQLCCDNKVQLAFARFFYFFWLLYIIFAFLFGEKWRMKNYFSKFHRISYHGEWCSCEWKHLRNSFHLFDLCSWIFELSKHWVFFYLIFNPKCVR